MKTIYFLLISLCCGVLPALSQLPNYEYVGVIKLNDSSFIPYKLAFEELDGRIQGYSISDMGGKHETKSNIKGVYDLESKTLSFSEFNIVYTKSPIAELNMCLVNFSGKMRNLKKNKAFSGDFKGLYPDQSTCLDGMILMSNARKVEERMAKVDDKIQKSKKYSQEIKDKVSAKRILDTLTMSIVKKGENLNIFTKTKEIMVSIYDSGKVDQDRINLYVDDVLILKDYAITRAKKSIPITITKKTTVVRVEAIDEGTSPPNTVKVEVKDGNELITTRTSLKANENAQLSFIRE